MENPLTPAEIVSGGLENLQYLINHYPINPPDAEPKVFVKVHIGHSGMGPEMIITFFGSRYDKTAPDVEIELWLGYEPPKYTLIFSAFDPKTDEIDHHVSHLTSTADARLFFEKAMQVFSLTAE